MNLSWTKPEGHSSFFTVHWTDGSVSVTENVTDTFKVISNLTSGGKYNITITAVAGDNETEGSGVRIIQYTSKYNMVKRKRKSCSEHHSATPFICDTFNKDLVKS